MDLACSDVLLPNKTGKNSIKFSEIIASTENKSEIKMMIIRLAVVITGPQYGGLGRGQTWIMLVTIGNFS